MEFTIQINPRDGVEHIDNKANETSEDNWSCPNLGVAPDISIYGVEDVDKKPTREGTMQ